MNCWICENTIEAIKNLTNKEAEKLIAEISFGQNICTQHLLLRISLRKVNKSLMGKRLLIAICEWKAKKNGEKIIG